MPNQRLFVAASDHASIDLNALEAPGGLGVHHDGSVTDRVATNDGGARIGASGARWVFGCATDFSSGDDLRVGVDTFLQNIVCDGND